MVVLVMTLKKITGESKQTKNQKNNRALKKQKIKKNNRRIKTNQKLKK